MIKVHVIYTSRKHHTYVNIYAKDGTFHQNFKKEIENIDEYVNFLMHGVVLIPICLLGYQRVMLEVDNSLLVDMVLGKANWGVKLQTGLDELCRTRR